MYISYVYKSFLHKPEREIFFCTSQREIFYTSQRVCVCVKRVWGVGLEGERGEGRGREGGRERGNEEENGRKRGGGEREGEGSGRAGAREGGRQAGTHTHAHTRRERELRPSTHCPSGVHTPPHPHTPTNTSTHSSNGTPTHPHTHTPARVDVAQPTSWPAVFFSQHVYLSQVSPLGPLPDSPVQDFC